MSMYGVFGVLLLVAVTAADKVAAKKHQQELKEHYEHLAYVADFPCHLPQPRVIPSHRLFSREERHGKAFFPDVTVLHRCDDAVGCCNEPGERCSVHHTEPVHLPFKITFLEDSPEHKKGTWIIDYFYFDNHTDCRCTEPAPTHWCPPSDPDHHEHDHDLHHKEKPVHHPEKPDHHPEKPTSIDERGPEHFTTPKRPFGSETSELPSSSTSKPVDTDSSNLDLDALIQQSTS